jgi:hypothetical protein
METVNYGCNKFYDIGPMGKILIKSLRQTKKFLENLELGLGPVVRFFTFI